MLQKIDIKKQMQGLEKLRKSQGAVIFIVLLVIVMLAAIGAIGVRSVQFELATSGSIRQAIQTRYLADAGVMVAAWEFGSSGKLSSFLKQMRKCELEDISSEIRKYCGGDYWVFDYNKHFSALEPGIFVKPQTPDSYHALGFSPMKPSFIVRVDNKVPVIMLEGFSVSGSNISGDEYEFQRWTFTSMGQERYYDDPATRSYSDSSDTLRVVSIVGPVRREK
jgi:hypothetical protein